MTSVIELDNPGPYSPGQIVVGLVYCTLNSLQTVEDITCSLLGIEQTHFRSSDDEFTGYKEFLREEITFFKGKIPPGSYTFPFSFKLPDSPIPSSFKHKLGDIWYSIETVLKRDGELCKNDRKFEVSVFVNLNALLTDVHQAPITYPIEETVSTCCCCVDDNRYVFMDMTLEKEAFSVGEYIFIKSVVSDRSNVKDTCLEIVLLTHTEFTANSPNRKCRVVKEELGKINGGIIIPKTYTFDLEIPKHITIPFLTGSTLIKQWYTLEVKFIPSGACPLITKFSVDVKLCHKEGKGPVSIGWSASGASTSTNSKYVDSKNHPDIDSPYSAPSIPLTKEEIERLLGKNGNGAENQPFLPPLYDEAIRK